MLVYAEPEHTPVTVMALDLPVPDVETAVDELVVRGVRFERHEGFAQEDEGIARGRQGPAIAWFTEPGGNIVSVLGI